MNSGLLGLSSISLWQESELLVTGVDRWREEDGWGQRRAEIDSRRTSKLDASRYWMTNINHDLDRTVLFVLLSLL